jgi:hypothetical protein
MSFAIYFLISALFTWYAWQVYETLPTEPSQKYYPWPGFVACLIVGFCWPIMIPIGLYLRWIKKGE